MPLYEREIWLKKRLGTLLKPIMGKIYDTKAPGYRRNDNQKWVPMLNCFWSRY